MCCISSVEEADAAVARGADAVGLVSAMPSGPGVIEDELIEDALGQFRARAKLIARGMGSKDWSLIQISVGSTGGAPHRVMMERDTRMMSRASAAPPAFEAGTSEVRVHVSGTVELD